jgi:phage-related minor tail protein
MSISALKAAVNQLANEKNASSVASHVRNIVQGIDDIGKRLADLEKRMAALEGK